MAHQPPNKKTVGYYLRSARAMVRARWQLRDTALGHRVRVNGDVRVRNAGTLRIGSRCSFHEGPVPTELNVHPGGLLEIGDECLINFGVTIECAGHVRLGPRTRIGMDVLIMDSNLHRIEPERRHERSEPRHVILGADVWLAARVLVLPGVIIGEGTVVGAGSVVTHDLPPRCVAVGVPAKPIHSV